jgi:hypothetical protein
MQIKIIIKFRVPFNINKMQFVFLWLLHDDSNTTTYIKTKLEYKHAYISRYVRPNMVIKVFNDMCETPLHKKRGPNFKKWVDLHFFH